MAKRSAYILLSLLLVSLAPVHAQTTQGKRFWVSFMANLGTTPDLTLHLSSKDPCSVTIENPNSPYSQVVSLAANDLQSITISRAEAYNQNSEVIEDKGLLVTSTEPISVFALNSRSATTDATLIIPEDALGDTYRIFSYNSANFGGSEFLILATADNTSIEVTPTATTQNNQAANTTFTVNLDQGETYQVQSSSNGDMTGTLIQSLAPNKPIAVFGGNTCVNVPTNCGACDHLFEQMYPIPTWGKDYLIIPTDTRSYDVVRVMADEDNTSFDINGTAQVPINKGEFYEFSCSTATQITSGKPIAVAQYAVGQSCAGNGGDPMMIWVSPVEQTINEIIFASINAGNVNTHYINIATRTSSIGNIELNNVTIPANEFTTITGTNYTFAKLTVSQGNNKISSSSGGFIGIAYGYGSADSYGYSVGSSARNLRSNFTINDLTVSTLDTIRLCLGDTAKFKSQTNFTPIQWQWDLGDGDTSNLESFSKLYPDTGTYRIRLISTPPPSLNEPNDTSFAHLEIVGYPQPTYLDSAPVICVGQIATISASGARTYAWTPDPDYLLSCLDCPNPSTAPVLTNDYYLTASNYQCSVQDTITVTVRDPLLVEEIPDTLVCYGTVLTLEAKGTGGDSTRYTFDWNNGNATNSTINLTVTNDTTLVVIMRDSCTSKGDGEAMQVTVRPPLVVSPRSDTTICQGQSVNLFASGSGGIVTDHVFSWDQGLGTGGAHSVTPDSTTTYRVILSDGCTPALDTAFITVTVRPPLDLLVSQDTTICKGRVASLSANGSGGLAAGHDYIWDQGLGSGAGQVVSPDSTTTYRVSFSDGCTTTPVLDSITVTVRPPLSVDAGADVVICKGQSVNLLALPLGGLGSGYDFTWDQGAGTTQDVIVSPADTTTYSVVLKDFCTIDPDTDWVTVFVRPELSLEVNRDTLVCAGSPVTLIAVASGGRGTLYSYTWDQGLGSGASQVVSPMQTTTYTATVTDGCTTSDGVASIKVSVEQPPVPVFAPVPGSVCIGEVIDFSNLSNLPNGSEYFWDLGDGTTDTLFEPSYVYPQVGTYDVLLRVTTPLGCVGEVTQQDIVIIRELPVADFSSSPDTASILAPRVVFDNLSQGAFSYLWDLGDGTSSLAENPVHDYLDTGSYRVVMIAASEFNCTDTVYRWIRINDEFVMHIPTAFSPNNDGINDVFIPVSSGVARASLNIYNRWGELVYTEESKQPEWDGMSDSGELVPEGVFVYILQVQDFTGKQHQFKGSITVLQ